MESFFFNTGDRRYKSTTICKTAGEHITRVDISNGIVFFDILLKRNDRKSFNIKNLDRMVVITVVKDGSFKVVNNLDKSVIVSKKDETNIYCSSRQNFTLTIEPSNNTEIFVLFIADFFLKRYLSMERNEPIDFLYQKIQDDSCVELIDTKPLDALSIHIVDKIVKTRLQQKMYSIVCEHNVIEFMIHRFSLLDMVDESIDEDELQIALKARKHLLHNFVSPPTIPALAHICATNETKLKRSFKKVFNTTIGGYIRKLRLEKANLLLKDRMLCIGEVAKEVGYSHQGYFCKLFFKAYGIYPKDLK